MICIASYLVVMQNGLHCTQAEVISACILKGPEPDWSSQPTVLILAGKLNYQDYILFIIRTCRKNAKLFCCMDELVARFTSTTLL